MSTTTQQAGLEAQIRDLTAANANVIYQEEVSASMFERPELARMVREASAGDVVIVTKLDRLARSTMHMLQIAAELEKKEVGLIVLSMGGERLDTRSPTGKLMITLLSAIAGFERELMLERQAEGIARARAEGKYKGRALTPPDKVKQILEMAAKKIHLKDVADYHNLALSTVYAILRREDPVLQARLKRGKFYEQTRLSKGAAVTYTQNSQEPPDE